MKVTCCPVYGTNEQFDTRHTCPVSIKNYFQHRTKHRFQHRTKHRAVRCAFNTGQNTEQSGVRCQGRYKIPSSSELDKFYKNLCNLVLQLKHIWPFSLPNSSFHSIQYFPWKFIVVNTCFSDEALVSAWFLFLMSKFLMLKILGTFGQLWLTWSGQENNVVRQRSRNIPRQALFLICCFRVTIRYELPTQMYIFNRLALFSRDTEKDQKSYLVNQKEVSGQPHH